MAYNGIDISNYQYGINLTAVPCDFVLILVSQGTSVANGDWERQFNQARNAGKMVGLYHYAAGGNAAEEAATFINATSKYNGQFVHVIDWESGGNRAWGITSYLAALWDNMHHLCGHTVMIYGPQSAYPWEIAKLKSAPTWVAQYADYAPTGYQTTPWNEGTYSCDIRQYSSAGRLSGWNGNLDLDKYYGTRDQWSAWCGNGDDMTQPADVWNYALGTDARSGYQNNPAWVHLSWAHHDTAKLVQMLCRTDDAGLKDGTSGDMYTRICWIDKRVRDMSATITALSAALETVSRAVGADPETIAQTVRDAVTKKLDTITITMQTKEQ